MPSRMTTESEKLSMSGEASWRHRWLSGSHMVAVMLGCRMKGGEGWLRGASHLTRYPQTHLSRASA